MKKRVKKVLNYKKPAFWIILVAILACTITAACFLTDPVTQSQPPAHVPGPLGKWYQIQGTYNAQTGEFQIEEFPGVTFRWNIGIVEAVTEQNTTVIIDAPSILNIGACDLNMDGYPEICVTAARSTQEHSCYVIVYDYFTKKSYTFPTGGKNTGYYLYTRSQYLMCGKERLAEDETYESGRLMLTGTGDSAELTIIVTPPPAQFTGEPVLWYDKVDPNSPLKAEVELEAFPGVTFKWNHSSLINRGSESLIAVKDGVETVLFPYGFVNSVYVADVTGDGNPDFCANVYTFFSGLSSFNAVHVYDYANDRTYVLNEANPQDHYHNTSYYVYLEDGKLICEKEHVATGKIITRGLLGFQDDHLYLIDPVNYESPIVYEKTIRDEYYRGTTSLVTNPDGTCRILFSSASNNSATGTYTQTDTHLTVQTEDGRTYIFRFSADGIIFQASGSSPLPKDSLLENGMLLPGDPYWTHEESD